MAQMNNNGIVRQMRNPTTNGNRQVAQTNVETAKFRDADKMSLPLGGISGGTQYPIKLRLGYQPAFNSDAENPSIDILATGLSQRGDTVGMSGVMTPLNLRYWRDQHYFRINPGKLYEVQIQATDEATLMAARLCVMRDSPWAPYQAEEYSLSSFINPSNLQRNNVIIPCDAELDGVTYLRLYHQLWGESGAPDDKFITMILRFARIAERRVAVGG